jgi:hypothetical protein
MRAAALIGFQLMLVVSVLVVSGCSVDPTDPSHFTDAVVRNDTPSPVVIVQCDTSCDTLHDRSAVPSHGALTINVSNEAITVGYAVERPSGRRLGCLYMNFDHVQKTPVVEVSSMQRC